MDPICHTLVGAALAQTGLKERTRFATAALVIGANLPDVDGITYLGGASLYWRRGWTHGILALAVWPFVLTGVMVALNRLVPRKTHESHTRWPRAPERVSPPLRVSALLQLSALAVLTHPALDFLNNYGLRWLMPFNGRWFYGDALFIVDPWIWLTLAIASAASWWMWRRRYRPWMRPAQAGVAAVALYSIVMLFLGQAGRTVARDMLASRGVAVARDPMIAPVFASPTLRYVVADDGLRYHVAAFDWWPHPRFVTGTGLILKNAHHPAVATAIRSPAARGFVSWARFPFFLVQDEGDAFVVTMDDARYAPYGQRSWAAVTVRVPRALAVRDDTTGARWEDPPSRVKMAVVASPALLATRSRREGSIAERAMRALATWCAP